jgi:hypothetical protein
MQVFGIPLFPRDDRIQPATMEKNASNIQLRAHGTTGPIRVLPAAIPLPSVDSPSELIERRRLEPAPMLQKVFLPATQTTLASGRPEQSAKASEPAAAIAQSPAVTPTAQIDSMNNSPSTSGRLVVSELPTDHFVHPVISDPNVVGELDLRALVGADGLVKEVTVLSGDRRLAEAGSRAVRQWHYRPYEAFGHPVEVETPIRITFFGQNTTSITSVANGSSSEPK